ncbi:hypothetical protein C8F04DRAFT_1295904 [Mycena alexandri]|uniref:Uncharacterized protein n=1 Tax=Mycena alexandri TaxID=1745969 RepID=A0AAD6SFV1_9AGAR|nr:hypothetical protein C8F04DRAFT_1295904 [Mycena alexandri]
MLYSLQSDVRAALKLEKALSARFRNLSPIGTVPQEVHIQQVEWDQVVATEELEQVETVKEVLKDIKELHGCRSAKKITAVLSRLPLPCGILLDKEYINDREALTAPDSYVHKVALETMGGKLLPVVIKWSLEADHGEANSPSTRTLDSAVYPFTEPHLTALRDGKSVELAGTEMEWLASIPKEPRMPFYTHNFEQTTVHWRSKYYPGTAWPYTACTEDKTHLGYALLLLRKPKPVKRKRKRGAAAVDEDDKPYKLRKVRGSDV